MDGALNSRKTYTQLSTDNHKMSGYPWYTRVTDIAHRLTVVGLVGFTVYMTAGVSYQLYQNSKVAEERLALQKAAQEKQLEFEQQQAEQKQ